MKFEKINASERAQFGSKGSKADRNGGNIPCVIYGGKENKHFTVKPNDVKSIIYTPEFKGAQINIDGKEYNCIIKEIQAHPVTDSIQHIDFMELVPGTKVKAEIPVKCKGVAPGLKSGGALVLKLRRVKVKALAENLVNELTVSISKLELGHSVRVRDIKIPKGIEIMSPGGTPIASIEIPRALKSAASAAAADAPAEEAAEAPAAE
ncbi:MAG: 50S ribosomal protein L25 [Bacteroidota bacterium]